MRWDRGFYLTIIHNFLGGVCHCKEIININGIGDGVVRWDHGFYLTIIHSFLGGVFRCKEVINRF